MCKEVGGVGWRGHDGSGRRQQDGYMGEVAGDLIFLERTLAVILRVVLRSRQLAIYLSEHSTNLLRTLVSSTSTVATTPFKLCSCAIWDHDTVQQNQKLASTGGLRSLTHNLCDSRDASRSEV